MGRTVGASVSEEGEHVDLEMVLGIVVFTALVLFVCPEWWSTSMGVLKEEQQKKDEGRSSNR